VAVENFSKVTKWGDLENLSPMVVFPSEEGKPVMRAMWDHGLLGVVAIGLRGVENSYFMSKLGKWLHNHKHNFPQKATRGSV